MLIARPTERSSKLSDIVNGEKSKRTLLTCNRSMIVPSGPSADTEEWHRRSTRCSRFSPLAEKLHSQERDLPAYAEAAPDRLRSWMPQTAASVDERAKVLRMLARKYPAIGWKLCLAQIPRRSAMTTDNNRPRWRSDASGAGRVATPHDHRTFIKCAEDILVSWPHHDEATLGDLVECIKALSEDRQSTVWNLIENWSQSQNNEKAIAALRERIRRFVSMMGGSKAQCAYEKLQPSTPTLRHAWLFADAWVAKSRDEITEQKHDFDTSEARIDKLRRDAMAEIWRAEGLDGVLQLAKTGNHAYTIGRHAAPHVIDAATVFRTCLASKTDTAAVDLTHPLIFTLK